MTSQKKPGLLDRAKKLGEQLFTKRNMAIAAPIVAGAAALSSKRVRDAVGDAAKTAGDAIVKATPTRKKAAKAPAKPAASTSAKPAASTSAKRSAAGKTGAAKRNSTAAAKPAAKPKAAAKPKPAAKRAKPAARKPAAPKAGGTPSGA